MGTLFKNTNICPLFLGTDLEGRLIACTQCGECYHPTCINVRVTKVILQKGWRCLDCTVCEGCGHKVKKNILGIKNFVNLKI